MLVNLLNNSLKIASLAIIALVASGCAQKQYLSKQEAFPEMYKEQPLSILVIHAVNDSTAAEAGDYYSATIAPTLSYNGYYVMPMEVTTAMLRNEGVQDGRQLLEVPAERFKEMFGADAVLYVNITEWDTNYYVVGGNVTVAIAFELRSTQTGENLWSYKVKRAVSTGGNSNNGLIGMIIETAINTAMQDYMPVAKQVNTLAISSMPVGAYHPAHNEDQLIKSVDPELQGSIER